MKTHAEAAKRFRQGTTVPGLDHTSLRKEGDNYVLRYYKTDIVTFHGNGAVEFDTGGWMTPSTVRRFNLYAPRHWNFRSKSGVLWLYYEDDRMAEFQDGLFIHQGKVYGAASTQEQRDWAGFMRATRGFR